MIAKAVPQPPPPIIEMVSIGELNRAEKTTRHFFPKRVSVPFIRRTILDWWRQTAKTQTRSEKPNTTQNSVPVFGTNRKTEKGKATAAAIEARETYLLEKKTTTQTIAMQQITAIGNKAKITPPEV